MPSEAFIFPLQLLAPPTYISHYLCWLCNCINSKITLKESKQCKAFLQLSPLQRFQLHQASLASNLQEEPPEKINLCTFKLHIAEWSTKSLSKFSRKHYIRYTTYSISSYFSEKWQFQKFKPTRNSKYRTVLYNWKM